MNRIAYCIAAALAVAGCGKDQPEATPGVYVEISLKNEADIDKYVVFNPNLRSIKACEETFAGALPSVMANLPAAIPKDSVATGWKCSLEDPSRK
jgi:hypothetical protein